MMGPQHRMLGALAGASLASAGHQPWPVVAMAALTSSATAHGWASPDCDLVWPLSWLGHRKFTHWWGLPAAAWVWGLPALPAHGWMGVAPRGLASLLLIGWVSHLAGDLVFGEVPMAPWGWRVGLGFDTGGFVETVIVRWGLVAALAWVVAGTPAWPREWHGGLGALLAAWHAAGQGARMFVLGAVLVALPLSVFVGSRRTARSRVG